MDRPLTARTPRQGLRNVDAVNWPMYALAVSISLGLAIAAWAAPSWRATLLLAAVLAALPMLVSLIATAWVYDFSDLYQLPWAAALQRDDVHSVMVLNAGFDEITAAVRTSFPHATLRVLDFFDEERTRERSIARARALYPPDPSTARITPPRLPVESKRIDVAIAFMSLHELRDARDRVALLREVRRVLGDDGRLVVVEHMRDWRNAVAYAFGVFHFLSPSSWTHSFEQSGFKTRQVHFHTPLVRTYILEAQ